MQYMLLIYGNEKAMGQAATQAVTEMTAAYMAYTKALIDAKVLVAGDRLKPTATSTTLRTVDGKLKVQDGPFAETREQLGGYYIIEAPDLDAAMAWAKKCPGAVSGSVELRPVWQM